MKKKYTDFIIFIVAIGITLGIVFGGWEIKRYINWKFGYKSKVESITENFEKRIKKLESYHIKEGNSIMSMKTLENEILWEAKKITGIKNLKMKDILEWSTGKINPEEGDKLYFLPELQIHIAIKK